VFALARLSHLHFLFDPLTGVAALGCAVAGIALALGMRRSPERASLGNVAGWLSAGAVAAAAAVSLPELLPLGSIPVYVAVVLIHVAPFWCVGRGLDGLLQGGASRLWAAGVAGKVVGVLLAAACLDRGPHLVAWAGALLLASVGVVVGGRRRIAARLAAATAVVVAATISGDTTGLPRRVHDPAGLMKPVISELVPGGRAELAGTVWNADGRTDRLEFGGPEVPWTFTNGTAPVPVPVAAGDLAWWRARFPLVALPFVALQPDVALAVGSTVGAERPAAARFSSARVLAASYDPGGVGRAFADPRTVLAEASGSLDLVFLASSHTTKSVHLHANVRDDRLWTREAFAAARAALRPGGALAVVTSDERLFARAVATGAESGGTLAERAWGFRIGEVARASPYRFLLLAWNEPPPAEVAERVRAAATEWAVQPLFGPGVAAVPPYDTLTGEALGRAFSRRAGAWVELAPATDARPGFFEIAREAHPYSRWLVATCLAPLLLVLLGPLGAERRRAAEEGGVPVAVALGELALLGIGFAFVLAAFGVRVPFATGIAFSREPAALAGLAAGFGIAWGRIRRPGASFSLALPAAAVIVVALAVGAGEAALVAVRGSAVARQLVAGAVGAGLGAAAATTLGYALQRLATERPEAASWGWIAFGLGAAGGVSLAAWVSHVRGWPEVGAVVIAVHFVSVGVGVWSRVVPRRTVRADG
jgi:hypothetical protein